MYAEEHKAISKIVKKLCDHVLHLATNEPATQRAATRNIDFPAFSLLLDRAEESKLSDGRVKDTNLFKHLAGPFDKRFAGG